MYPVEISAEQNYDEGQDGRADEVYSVFSGVKLDYWPLLYART